MRMFRNLSRAARTVVILGGLLLVLVSFGWLNAGSDIPVTSEQAVEVARPLVDFEPVDIDARVIRQGFANIPVWAVSLSIPDPTGDREFERIALVEVDGRTAEVIRVRMDDELSQ